MNALKNKIETLKLEIEELEDREYCTEHNQGTYDAFEAVRKVGTADPRHANYARYETVAGKIRIQGCAKERAPGRIRVAKDDAASLAKDRQQLRELLDQLRKLEESNNA